MIDEQSGSTLGSALLQLKQQSGLSLAKIAQLAGYQSASAIQRFFNADYNPAHPSISVARRLARALDGWGTPPIEAADVLRIYGDFEFAAQADTRVTLKGPIYIGEDEIPITRAERALNDQPSFGGTRVQVFIRKFSGTMIKCPEHLVGRGIAAFYLPSSNMQPRYDVGDLIVFDGLRPAKVGDYVVVRLTVEYDLRQLHFVARLEAMDETHARFSQLSPLSEFGVELRHINFMGPVVSTADLLPAIRAASD